MAGERRRGGGGGWGWEVGHGEAVVRDETSGFAAALSAVRGQALCAIARAVGRGNGVGREGGSRHATGAVCVCVFFFFFLSFPLARGGARAVGKGAMPLVERNQARVTLGGR